MKISVPKDNKEEAQVYLRAWLALHEGEGVNRTKRMIRVFLVLSLVAGVLLVASVLLSWHPGIIAAAGVVLGFSGAESAGLKSRLRAWPHNEKYYNWEAIKDGLKERESAG